MSSSCLGVCLLVLLGRRTRYSITGVRSNGLRVQYHLMFVYFLRRCLVAYALFLSLQALYRTLLRATAVHRVEVLSSGGAW